MNPASQQIKGYELKERIGAGGFGAVYRAHQTTVGREVAIKIILPGLANQPDFIRRFETEAQLVARLEHPHITPLYDYWRDPDGAYLVMRWLRGGSLRDALQNGAFELQSAALVLDQIAGALSLAHRNGVIHRDLKPANILLDEDGNAYLTDFGIAKDLNLPGSGTQADAIVGSLDYISPEQARSEPVTARTDIYSLGVTLFELVTGHHPFENMSSVERLYKHINDPLPKVTTINAGYQEAVNRVIQKATAKNPDYRYPDALAFAADFREAAGMNRTPTTVLELLTQREHEILSLIIDGLSNKEIAQRLTVTLSTVKWYVNQIYGKLGVRSRVQAIVRSRELNLIVKPGEPVEKTVVATEDFRPKNPYKGLQAFQSTDYQAFFGREKITAKLVKRLGETGDYSRFLAVVGPSGSGKSSLVKAGLIPALWRGDIPGSEKWFVVEMLPGIHPLDELEIALSRVAGNRTVSLNEQLRRDARGLVRVTGLILPDDGTELVLIVDQFEELFTLTEDDAVRRQFMALLYAAVIEPRSRVRVVVTLRADFYDRPLHYPNFGELVHTRLETIMPLSAEELERAMTQPAENVGVSFEPGLVTAIVADVNYQPGALPLLQYALTELFEQRSGRQLTREAYQAIGGTVGALAKRAEELYATLDADAQAITQQMFLRLVTLGEGAEDTRRRTARSELQSITLDTDMLDEVIDLYASYRLLSLDKDPGSRTPTVEVAHEALLREWERLRHWLNDSRDEIRTQQQLHSMADEWRGAHKDVSFLARGIRLAQFEKWVEGTRLLLTPHERTYLAASIAHRDSETVAETERQRREKRLERRSQNFLRGLLGIMLLATIGAFILASIAIMQGRMAQEKATEAQQVALIAGSQAALVNDDTDLAIALAIEAVTRQPDSANAQSALSTAAYAPGTIRLFAGHTDYVDTAKFSPDGQTALSASWDGTLILWDIQTADIIRRLVGHTDAATSLGFLPDGQRAVSGSRDRTLILWDVQTGGIIDRFEGAMDVIWTLAISPDGTTVAAAGAGGVVWLWDIATGTMTGTLEGHDGLIEKVVFSHDGRRLLSSAHDRRIIEWDVDTAEIRQIFEGHLGIVTSVAYSPDETRIISSSIDGRLILWDRDSGELLDEFYEEREIWDVAFTRDGLFVVSSGIGGGLLKWDIATGLYIETLWGHGGTVVSLDINADNRRLLSSSADGTVRLWDMDNGQIIHRVETLDGYPSASAASADGRLLMSAWYSPQTFTTVVLMDVATGEEIRRHTMDEYLDEVVFSPDGRLGLFVTELGPNPSDLVLWDVQTGEVLRRFTGHPYGISAAAFSPDGSMIISAGYGGYMILWDVATAAEIRRFSDYEGEFGWPNIWISVAFSPDGQTIAASHFSGAVMLLDVASGTKIRDLIGHAAWVFDISFSADGTHAYTGSEDKLSILWDVKNGAIYRQFEHSSPVAGVSFSGDGSLGLESMGDKALLRDLTSGEVIRRYSNPNVSSQFMGDDTMLLSRPPHRPAELWRIDRTLDDLMAWVRANRYIPELGCEQREIYQLEPLCSSDTL